MTAAGKETPESSQLHGRYPPKTVPLADGTEMLIRQAEVAEVPTLLRIVRPLRWVKVDDYDRVTGHVVGDLSAWQSGQRRDPYCLLGFVDGVLAGLVTGRAREGRRATSYHALALHRGLRVGALLLAAKMEHLLEVLGEKEIWIATDNALGHRRWLAEYPLEARRGYGSADGQTCWVLTREVYLASRPRLVSGQRPVDPELLSDSRRLVAPDLSELTDGAAEAFEARL